MKPKRLFSPLIVWLCFILSACSGLGVPLSVPEVTLSPLSVTPLPSSSSKPATPMSSTTPSIAPDVNQIIEQARWGKGAITGSEFSPDGKRLGVVTTLGIYIYDAENLKQLDFIPGGSSAWPTAAFSPDWSLLAMGSGSTVTLLHLADKIAITHFETDQGGVVRLLFSPDGRMLVSLVQPPGEEVYTQILDLWGVSDGKLLGSWKAGALPDLAFTADSKTIYAWNPNSMEGIYRWQIPSGSPLPVLKALSPSGLAFSPDGRLMASAGISTELTEISIQRISSGTQVRKLSWGQQWFSGKLLFSGDGSLLAAYSYDGLAKVWRTADGTLLQSFDASSAYSKFLAISPDDQTLVLPAADGLIFYSLTDGRSVRQLKGHFNPIDQAALSPQGDRMAALINGASDPATSSLVVWTFPEGQMLYSLTKVGAIGFAWSPDGDRLALADWDDKIRILRSTDGTVVQTLPGHSEQVQSVAWSPDGTKIASSSMQSVKVWRVIDGMLLNELSVSGGWVNSLRYSPDGKMLAGSSASEKIEVWQTSDGQRIAEFPVSTFGDSNVIEFAPDGSFLAVAEQSRLSLWHLNEDKPFQQLPITDAGVITLRISPDGSLLTCGLTNGTILLWQMPEGKLLRTLISGNEGIFSLDISNDGKTLLSASRDGTIRFWSIQK